MEKKVYIGAMIISVLDNSYNNKTFENKPKDIKSCIFGFFFVLLRQGFFACPGIHSVDQVGFELTEIHLPLPPKCWD